jgi:hypothetical protein
MRPLLSATGILNANDRPLRRLSVPEWDGDVCIARLNGADAQAYSLFAQSLPPESFEHVVRLLALTLVSEEKVRLFTDEAVKDLQEKNPAVLTRIFRAAIEHNWLGDREVTRAEGESEPSR